MTRSTNRRAAASLAAAATAAGLLLTGCSAGQLAETARKNPSIQGVNGTAELRGPDRLIIGSVAVRDAHVAYAGPEGYEEGRSAPIEVRLFNDLPDPVTVRVSSPRVRENEVQVVGVTAVELIGSAEPSAPTTEQPPIASPSAASPSPAGPGAEGGTPAPGEGGTPAPGTTPVPGADTGQGSPEPGTTPAPAAAAASIRIPAGGFVVLSRDNGTYLQVTGLTSDLRPGERVPLVFDFGQGLVVQVLAPVAPPLSPVPRASPENEGLEGGH